MTPDERAIKAINDWSDECGQVDLHLLTNHIAAAIRKAAVAEREAIALMVGQLDVDECDLGLLRSVVAAIRARG